MLGLSRESGRLIVRELAPPTYSHRWAEGGRAGGAGPVQVQSLSLCPPRRCLVFVNVPSVSSVLSVCPYFGE